jgi:hypothetical protein
MERRTKWIVGSLVGLAVLGIGAGVGVATVGDDDKPLTGDAYDRATAAALSHVGGGTVTDTEVGDDGATYGVEISRDDGSDVEVQLDAAFRVIGSSADDDGSSDVDETGEGD